MYLPELKCKAEMFDIIPTIKIGDIKLRPIIFSQIEFEAKCYNIISSDSLVEKFLPGAYTTDKREAFSKLVDSIRMKDAKNAVLFCISLLDDRPLGYIDCNSPLTYYHGSNEKIGQWTINFWLHKNMRGRGFMTLGIRYLLDHMQKMQIPKVYAYVDKTNTNSIKVLKDCTFKIIDETADDKMYIFAVSLND